MKALMIVNVICWTGLLLLVVFNVIPATKMNYILALVGCVTLAISGTITANRY